MANVRTGVGGLGSLLGRTADAVRVDASTRELDVLTLRLRDASLRKRDGRLEGLNIELTRRIAEASGIRVTASGGFSSLEDIERLCELEPYGVDSVIVGKALYEGRLTLQAALGRASECNQSRL